MQKIHLRITIEGELFEKIFEADPNLKYTYSWKGINVYRQRVYGTTTALVKVGYEYEGCSLIIWNVQSTRISGQDLSVSNIGGWDLDIHHRYNFQEGILYKGDGTNIYLKDTPALIFTTMGDGSRRPVDCAQCDGGAALQRLLSPFAIVSAPDGSLYLGDFNLMQPAWRIATTWQSAHSRALSTCQTPRLIGSWRLLTTRPRTTLKITGEV